VRIGMLLDKPFPPDPRVANEARSLVAAGHEVFVFCLDLKGTPARETLDGVEIVRHPMSRGFWKKAGALILTVPAYRLWFRARLPGFLRDFRIEALHVHDLPLVGEGLRAAGAARIPLVADLHENYPAAVRLYAWARRWPARWLVSATAWDAYERRVLPRADRIVVVIEEARQRLLDSGLGLDARRIAVVANTVHVQEFEGFPPDPALERRLAAGFPVLYLGTFDRHRGLEAALDAVALARAEIPDLRLVLVGTGSIEGELRRRARELGIADRVDFEGWQPFARFPAYVRGSRVCLIPHLKSPHTDTTIPHKLFHYMLLERPVVATDCAPIERIVRETGAGRIYPSGDAAALARTLVELRDAERRRALGEAGRRAVLERYRWDLTARELVALYAGLATG
jgi:glycosyltransferase involved in cell wall biosynthesis